MGDPAPAQHQHAPAHTTNDSALFGPPAPAAAGSGLAQVQAITTEGDAAATAVVNVLRAHPEERAEIMEWLNHHRGMAFAKQVEAKQGEVERNLPGQLTLQSVRASVSIPGGRQLGGNWLGTASTRSATTVQVEVTPTNIRVSMRPMLAVDVQWPGKNADIAGAGINFATGAAFADVRDGDWGLVSSAGFVSEKLVTMLRQGIAGTPLGKPGYSPMQDPDLKATLDAVVDQFTSQFAGEAAPKGPTEGGAGGSGGASGAGGGSGGQRGASGQNSTVAPIVALNEIRDVSAGGTFSLKTGGQFLDEKGTGLTIAPGSNLSVDMAGDNNLEKLSGTTDAASAAQAANVQSIEINAGDLQVLSKGKPVARIHSLHIGRGGSVKIGQMDLLGKAQTAETAEKGLSLLVALLAVASNDGATANDALQHAQGTSVVSKAAQKQIETEFTASVRSLINQYRYAVPGIDLVQALGL